MTGARVRIPPSPPRKRDRICGLFFVLHKRRRDEKGTARLWRVKNHPANGFLVPRAGGGTAPVPPDESLLLRHEKEIAFAVSFSCCIKEGGMRKGTTRLWREKNHPVNGFLVPRAGVGTAPVPPGESLLLRQLHAQHNVLCTRCFWGSFYNRYGKCMHHVTEQRSLSPLPLHPLATFQVP